MGRPELSVLVLAYNYARYLPECLDSILGQSFGDFEVVVLDDASTDDTPEVVARHAALDGRVRAVRHATNQGFAASLVEGTEVLSQGDFRTVISADDVALDATAFQRQVEALRASPRAVAAVSAYVKLAARERQPRRLPFADGIVPSAVFTRKLLTDRECAVLHSGTMVRATAYVAAGGYDARLHNYLDLAFFVRLGLAGDVCYVDELLYGYRVHPDQFSGGTARRQAMLGEGIAVLRAAVALANERGLALRTGDVLRARVADLALAEAFANRRKVAALRCFDAVRLAPCEALTSGGLWLALARAALGQSGWRGAARLGRASGYRASPGDRGKDSLPPPRVGPM